MAEVTKEELITLMLKENENITKHLEIGLTRLIILWKISKGNIHGYNLMKTVDEFYKDQIELGLVKKANPSKKQIQVKYILFLKKWKKMNLL